MSKLPWDGPLFSVSGHLAERYAVALKYLGGPDLPIGAFQIDRLGWSPQLAAMLGADYLDTHGLRHAIILSPEQEAAPPLRRYFSYEAPLIERVYLEARPTLLHLIEQEPVIVDFDNGLHTCRTAVDVLSIKTVRAHIMTPRDTLSKTRQLLDLGKGFTAESRLLDNAYIDRMLALTSEVGDPRRRPLPVPLELSVGSLRTEAAGGVYIFRLPQASKHKTVVLTAQYEEALTHLTVTPLEIESKAVVDLLHKAGLLRYLRDDNHLRKRLGELERDALLTAGDEHPATDLAQLRRQLARNPQAQAALRPVYWELDAEAKRLQMGAPFAPERLSIDGRWALSAPTRDADVMVHLLARFVPYDYRMLAYHQRALVEQEWGSYSEAKRRYLAGQFPYLTQSFVPMSATAAAPPSSNNGSLSPMQEAGGQPSE